MNILLDTQITIWSIVNDKRLTDEARAIIADENNIAYYKCGFRP